MIKGVIFDVDGVLLNSMPVWENLGELYLDHLGIEAEKNLGETLFEMSLEEAADYLISHYNLEKTVEEVVQGLNKEVEDYYAKRVPLKEGVRQYLEEFRERKIPMVIATTGDRKNAEAALSRLKVLPYFQGVFTASEIGSGKDQPDIYFAALLQLLRGNQRLPAREFRQEKFCGIIHSQPGHSPDRAKPQTGSRTLKTEYHSSGQNNETSVTRGPATKKAGWLKCQ